MLSNEKTDEIRRQAFEQFQISVNQEAVERMADQFIVRREHCPEFTRVVALMETFSSKAIVEERAYCWIGALKRRDAEFWRLIGADMYDPDTHQSNPRYQQKLWEVVDGRAAPALRVVS